MDKLRTYILLAASFTLLVLGCSNKSSDEACLYKTSMDLDKGNYDAVLASGCADAMQKGAAYFGKAGFDITTVINNFSKTASPGSTSSNLNVYMTSMIGQVSEDKLNNMDLSVKQYTIVTTSNPPTSSLSKDANFYLGLVDAVKSLSLLKLIMDTNGDGTLNTSCDMNNNKKPDELDATGCALLTSAPTTTATCALGTSVTTSTTDIFISKPTGTVPLPGTYRGLVITVADLGGQNSTCPSPNEYKHLLYKQSATIWAVVTTSPGAECKGTDGNTWPCPMLDANGQPLDLVSTVSSGLNSAVSSMGSALPSSGPTTTTDVQQSIQNIQTTACPTGTCTSTDLATYLNTYK